MSTKAPTFFTPIGRLSYAQDLLTGRDRPDGSKNFSTNLVIAPPKELTGKNMQRLSDLKAGIQAQLRQKFGDGAFDAQGKVVKAYTVPMRLIDAENTEALAHFAAGSIELRNVSSRFIPRFARILQSGEYVNIDNEEERKRLFYSGAHVILEVAPLAYEYREKQGGPVMKKGVSLALNAVLFVRDGERIGGPRSAAETFSALEVDPEEYGFSDAAAAAAVSEDNDSLV